MSRVTRAAGCALAAALLLVGGCSGDGGDATADDPGVTLPPVIDLNPPGTTSPTVPGGTASTSTTATTAPALEGTTIVESLRAAPGSSGCTGGTVPVVVTFFVRSARPVRVYNVYLDGAREPAASSNTADPLVIPAVPCDGQNHQVLLIAAVDQDDVATQSAAFRAPGPG